MVELNKKGNTKLYVAEGCNVVKLHNTEIVKFNEVKIILDTGGWKTKVTKDRMNQASAYCNLGFNVYQKDYSWFVSFKGKDLKMEGNSLELTR